MNITICHERHVLALKHGGSAEAREEFSRNFPGVLQLRKDGFQFNCAGLFQIKGAKPLLVLPWFLVQQETSKMGEGTSSPSLALLDAIRGIEYSAEALVDVSAVDENQTAAELLHHSFLSRLHRSILNEARNNYFRVRTDDISAIRGKWLMQKDLSKTLRPLKFHCEFEEADPSNEILIFAKSVAHWIQGQTITRANSELCTDIITQLAAIDLVPLTEAVINRAERRAQREKGRESWRGIIAYGNSIFHDRDAVGTAAGTAYQFPMDHFFELLIEDTLRISGRDVITQSRRPVLGKSYWEAASQIVDADDIDIDDSDASMATKNATVVSKPDIVMKDERIFSVIECKYKPFKIPLIDGPPNTEVETAFKRNDRNQLLSFILSLEDSDEIGNRSITFNVVFPHIAAKPVLYSDLVFRHARLQLSGGWKHVSQFVGALPDGSNPIRIRFVGVDVVTCIKTVEEGKQSSELLKIVDVLTNHTARSSVAAA